MLLWLYVTALAVLIGAALNAEIDKHYPGPMTARARRRAARGRPGGSDNPVTTDQSGS